MKKLFFLLTALCLSAIGLQAQPYYMAGNAGDFTSGAWIGGTSWKADGAVMTQDGTDQNIWTYSADLEASETAYAFKITTGAWSTETDPKPEYDFNNVDTANSSTEISLKQASDSETNITFTLTKAGTVTITFDSSTTTITVAFTATESGTEQGGSEGEGGSTPGGSDQDDDENAGTTTTITVPDNLYLIGAATSAEWTIGNAIKMDKEGEGSFTWTGSLTAVANGFKFLCGNDNWEPAFVSPSENKTITSGVAETLNYLYKVGDANSCADYQFVVPETGTYTIAVTITTTSASMVVTQQSTSEEGGSTPGGDDTTITPSTADMWLYGSSFGTDFSVDTYKQSPTAGVYTWTFDTAKEVDGWMLIPSVTANTGTDADQNPWIWNQKYTSTDPISLANGATEVTIDVVDNTAAQNNINITGKLLVTKIVLDTNTNKLTVTGSENTAADPDELYLRGLFNGWLDNADDDTKAKYLGSTSDNGVTYTWDLSSLEAAEKTLVGGFQIATMNWSVQYGAATDGTPIEIDTPLSVTGKGNITASEPGIVVTTITLNTSTKMLTVSGTAASSTPVTPAPGDDDDTTITPSTADMWLYGSSFGTDFSDDTYKQSPTDGVYTWTFSTAKEVEGWMLIPSVTANTGTDANENPWIWNQKYTSTDPISLANGATEVAIDVEDNIAAQNNITITGKLLVTEIVLNTNTNKLTVKGSENTAAGPDELYLRGEFNGWLNGADDDTKAKYLGSTSDNGVTYTWDMTSWAEADKTLVGGFQIATMNWSVQYGAATAGTEIEIDTELSVAGTQDITIAAPGIVVTTITLNTSTKMLTVSGTPASSTPVTPDPGEGGDDDTDDPGTGGDTPVTPSAWYVAGDTGLCNGWEPNSTPMTAGENGIYTYSKTVVAGTYNFKVTNGNWYDPEKTPDGVAYGYANVNAAASTPGYEAGSDNNVKFTVSDDATITISIDPSAADASKLTLTSTVDFGTVTISYWVLAGNVPFFTGAENSFNDAEKMTESTTGVWTKTYSNVEITSEQAGQNYWYKVAANGKYSDGQYPDGMDSEAFTIAEAGTYNVTFTYNATTPSLTYTAIKQGGTATAVDEVAEAVVYAANGRIYVEAEDYTIFNLIGQDVTAQNGSLKGSYIVLTNDTVVKVRVN